MKILMVTRESQADKRYGLGRSLIPLVEELRRQGHSVGYLCREDCGQRSEHLFRGLHAVLIHLFQRMSGATEDTPAVLWALLERLNMGRLAAKVATCQGYTHVHCHDPWIALGFRLFCLLRLSRRIFWGVTEHGFGCYAQATHEDGGRQGTTMMYRFRRLEAAILRRADWVISPTFSGIRQLARDLCVFPIPASWHAVPHARPKITHYGRAEARRSLGWSDDFFYVLGVGRLAPLKQFPMLIQACAMAETPRPVRLVILGEGDTKYLHHVGVEAGLGQEIMFGITDDIGLYLAAADVYISTSSTESFGMANLEALVAGIPAVCTAVGGVPEVVGAGAWLVSPEVAAVGQAIETLAKDDALRSWLSKYSMERGAGWPEITEIARRYEEIYRQAEKT